MSEILSRLWNPEEQKVFSETSFPPHILAGGRHWAAQHEARAWEYGAALHAALVALDKNPAEALILDVGGAGSPLAWGFAAHIRLPMQIIDPEFNGLGIGDLDIRKKLDASAGPLRGRADFIACISVLEHVENELEFLIELAALLAPGGVLFLTVDYDPSSAPADTFMFHWMRRRIYTPESFYLHEETSVAKRLMALGLKHFGDVRVPLAADLVQPPTIPGLGYTFASLCMRKEL